MPELGNVPGLAAAVKEYDDGPGTVPLPPPPPPKVGPGSGPPPLSTPVKIGGLVIAGFLLRKVLGL